MIIELLHIRREGLVNKLYSLIFYRLFQLFLGTLLIILPAVLYGCTDASEKHYPEPAVLLTEMPLMKQSHDIASMDVFVFHDDRLQRLDCYQRFDDMDDWNASVISGSGKRIITAVANCPFTREDWAAMNSRSYLKKMAVRLEDEERDRPQMSGEKAVDTSLGNSSGEDFPLRPFMSEIRLNSLCCDFTGKAYAGEKLSDIKVYLTNVNAECRILEEEDSPPRRIINAGGLREEDVMGFNSPDIIVQEIDGKVGRERIYPGVSLMCYRSSHPAEGPGTPYTRLVIEGKISGRTYYWPISINRTDEDGSGILRNRRYIYDIKITCKGSFDPDMPVKAGEISINQHVTEWEEKEGYEVAF